jgi:hypothetical protein
MSQPWALDHLSVHTAMIRQAWRERDRTEIGGAWLIWQGVREHRGVAWIGAGIVALAATISAPQGLVLCRSGDVSVFRKRPFVEVLRTIEEGPWRRSPLSLMVLKLPSDGLGITRPPGRRSD